MPPETNGPGTLLFRVVHTVSILCFTTRWAYCIYSPTHNDDDGLQNRLECPPRIWHIFSLSIRFLLIFPPSVACTTSCSRSAKSLFVRCLACSDFLLYLPAHSSSLHYIAGQWLRRPRQIHLVPQNARLRLLTNFHHTRV